MAQNRKQRRAAAAAEPKTADDIPLRHPPSASESRRGKTLLEIAAERQGQMPRPTSGNNDDDKAGLFNMDAKETQFVQISPDGNVSRFNPDHQSPSDNGAEGEENSSLPPVIDTLLLSTPLTTLHLTLSFLAAHQYAQFIQLGALVRESVFVAFPVLTLCIHVAHGHVFSFGSSRSRRHNSRGNSSSSRQQVNSVWDLFFGAPSPKTLFFLPLAVFLGVYLMAITNEEGYYAVMKRAPSIGTMWVWCVLEIPPAAGLLAFLAPLGWGAWYKGYAII